jgi:mannose-6-phosphate isomerase-like protein (cupin superfamily)
MKIAHLSDATSWFEVLQTTRQCQTAVMTLTPGGQSSEDENTHKKSDQVLLVLEGEVEGEVEEETFTLCAGDVIIIPAGTPHRFENKGPKKAVTFNVYTPPEYAADEKG